MKKSISLLIAGFLLFTLIPFGFADDKVDAFAHCEEIKPNFGELAKPWDDAKEKTHNLFEEVFDASQAAYHDYMSCLFGTAFAHVLKEEGEDSKKMIATVPAKVTSVNWLLPGQACLTEDDLIQSIEGTSPEVLMPKALGALDEYQDFLFGFYEEFEGEGKIGEEIDPQIAAQARSKTQQISLILQKNRQRVNNEVESSLIALEIAFNSLKELRLSFVFHVRLQCIIHQLGRYQQVLGDLRRIAESMPKALRNASVSP